MNKEYIQLDLVRVTNHDNSIKYYAVNPDTAENMMDTSSAMQYIVDDGSGKYQKLQFEADYLGPVLVETSRIN